MDAGGGSIRWLRVAMWVFGIGTIAGAASLGWDWQASLAPTPIRYCFVEPGRTRFVHITTADGVVILAPGARCPAGKTISKRRGEFVYRVDGAPLGTTFHVLFERVLALFAFGGAFVLAKNLLSRLRAGGV